MIDAPLRFSVRGLPVPQGALKVGVVAGRAHLFNRSSGPLGDWRHAIAAAAQPHAPPELWTGPVAVRIDFVVPRPASLPTHRGRGKSRVLVRSWPAKRPDLDKYVRAVLDALTNVVWRDDGQVVEIHATKDYGVPGATIEVRRVG